MKHLKSTKKSKHTHTRPLPIGKKSRGVLAVYAAVVFTVCCLPMTAFAAGNDPLTVINNLSDFIFGVIRAVGLILLGWGIVQIGLSFQSHDPSQRSNGFLTLAGGVVVTFANSHIEFVMDCLQKNTTEIRNMKQYLLTVLFNAPTTISNHYTSQVNHDLYGGW